MLVKQFLFTFGFVIISFLLIGVGKLFLGRKSEKLGECGTVPEAAHEDCPSQKAGLCPIEDETGMMNWAQKNKISYKKGD